jgi:D-glycero-D-manno-heptose 1,7-bisphosphate phosphatase
MNRAAFLDRDGVINYKAPEGQYVTCREQFQFIPKVEEAIASLNKAGYAVIVVTNQRCVAKGLLTAQELDSLHEWMRRELADAGAIIAGVYSCPHENEPPCSCRKPAPGMLLTAASAHNIHLSASWMIGDSDVDIEAGRNAGCRTVRILKLSEAQSGSADLFASSLLSATVKILELDPNRDDSAL